MFSYATIVHNVPYLDLFCADSLCEWLSPMSSMARDQQPKPVKYTVHFLDNSEATFEVDVSCDRFFSKLRASAN